MKIEIRELGNDKVLGVDVDGGLVAKFIGERAEQNARAFAEMLDPPWPPDTPEWLVALVAAFGRKVIPLDVTDEGTYEEATTRWGMNPVYEAVPEKLRMEAESRLHAETQRYFSVLRTTPSSLGETR